MQIFEFHFNPKLNKDEILDSFVYEPQNIYEKRLGNLYIVGKLQNTFSKNSIQDRDAENKKTNLLNELARLIKREYYNSPVKIPEQALSKTLKKINEFLSEEIKKDNVGWLGNLNFSVLSLRSFDLSFTKTGSLKILLIRNNEITDIGKSLEIQEINPYPLKIFFNTVSGKLIENDILIVLSKEIFEFFYEQKILSKIARTTNLNYPKLKEILPHSLFEKGEGSKISGICLLSIVKQEVLRPKENKKIKFQKQEKFSYYAIFEPVFIFLKKINPINRLISLKKIKPNQENSIYAKTFIPFRQKLVGFLSLLKNKALKVPIGSKREKNKNILEQENIKLKNPKIAEEFVKKKYKITPDIDRIIKSRDVKKRFILIFVFILLLFLGFLIFQKRNNRQDEKVSVSLVKIQEKVNQAENFLIIGEDKNANSIFIEAWKEIAPLNETENDLEPKAIELIAIIKDNLENLNKLERIENPEQGLKEEYEKALNAFSLPDNLIPPANIDFSFDLSAEYFSNLYFLDKKTCQIIKYPYLSKSHWGLPQIWKEPDVNCSEPKSFFVNGPIWILNKDNSISRYYLGAFEEKIELTLFPLVQNISQIKSKIDLPYIYLLEPPKKRIIVIDVEGEIIKQFQSEKFDDLKDFSISDNGKTIYLLNSTEVYKINL
jgi:hypothetical protein